MIQEKSTYELCRRGSVGELMLEESGAKSTEFVSDPQQSWGGWEERDVGLAPTNKVETGRKRLLLY